MLRVKTPDTRNCMLVAAIQDMMDRTKRRLQRSQPKSPDGGGGDDPASGDDDKDDRDDDCGSESGYKGKGIARAEQEVVAVVI
jgi:hypothetical protein